MIPVDHDLQWGSVEGGSTDRISDANMLGNGLHFLLLDAKVQMLSEWIWPRTG